MTTLIVETKSVHTVDYSDFEEAVMEFYDVTEYSLPCDAECLNDTALTASVRKEPIDEYCNSRIRKFVNGEGYNYLWRWLLQDMVNAGVAPEGDYVIDISW